MTPTARVAYVCADPGVPVFGCKGCSVHVREVVRALRGLGADVELFATRPGDGARDGFQDLPVHPLPNPGRGDAAARERALRAANADLDAALHAAAAERGPFDLVYERYSLWSHAALDYAAARGTPAVLEVNAPLVEEQAAHRALADRAAAQAIARHVFSTASALACVSDGVGRYVRSAGAPADRVHVIPNGVRPERFGPDVRPSLPSPGVFTAGFVGTLKPWHGLEHLVEAFAAVRDAVPASRLLIVGDGPLRAALARSAEARGLAGAVAFTGAMPSDDVPALLRSTDAAVAPYPDLPDFYFSPLKLFEYMAAGLPVVASRVGQIADVLRDAETGLLVPPGDPAALAAALCRLAADPPLRRRLGDAARADVVAHHSWDQVARRVLAIAGIPDRAAANPGPAPARRPPGGMMAQPRPT